MADPQNPQAGLVPQYKGQPWILFDTVVAASFLAGDTSQAGTAIGSNTPAINAQGEMIFFNAPGRNNVNTPWYCNLDVQGQLAYGLEVWGAYLLIAMPAMPPVQNIGYDFTSNPGVPGTVKLAESILNFSVIELELGQENQTRFPSTRFGAGGGLWVNAGTVTTLAGNSLPQGANVLVLPEPIEMPRTQNLAAKLRISPQGVAMIGTPTAPGVGQALSPYAYGIVGGQTPTVVNLAQLPFVVQLGLIGRRIKFTQYGQVPAGAGG